MRYVNNEEEVSMCFRGGDFIMSTCMAKKYIVKVRGLITNMTCLASISSE